MLIFDKLTADERILLLQGLLSTKKLRNEELEVAAELVGSSQHGDFESSLNSLGQLYRDIEFLSDIDAKEYLSRYNPVLKKFLTGFCNLSLSESSARELYQLGRICELTYNISSKKNHVLPLAFIQNLGVYAETGSKVATELNGAGIGGGSYDTVKDWLHSNADTPLNCPSGDIAITFDNTQVIGKCYTLKPNSKIDMSVITNVIAIQLDEMGTLQSDPGLMPRNWLFCDGLKEKIEEIRNIEPNKPFFADLDKLHYEQLYYFINKTINVVKENVDENFSDDIDSLIKQIDEKDNCIQCMHCAKKGNGVFYNRSKLICDICQNNLRASLKEYMETIESDIRSNKEVPSRQTAKKFQSENVDENYERYDHIPSGHESKHPNISMCDPVFLNPDSHANLALVLRNTGINAGIHRYGGKLRHWLIVCCDGLPFKLCLNLLNETRVCLDCEKSFFGMEKFSAHCKLQHDDTMQKFYYEFDWVFLRPGGGHIEMNAIKSFFELNWTPFMQKLCEKMGFKSELAQNCAKRCTDHHKSWSLLVVFYIGSLRELVHCYLKALNEEKFPSKGNPSLTEHPSAEGFFRIAKRETVI